MPGVEAVAFLDDQPIGINGQTGSNGSYLIDNLTSASRVTVKATKPGLMPIQPIEADIQIGEITEGVDPLLWNQPHFAAWSMKRALSAIG